MTRPHGFTLIELAIVLVIITILVGGLAVPLSAQIQARRVAETRSDLQAFHDALIGFAMSNYVAPANCTCNYDSMGNFVSAGSCGETAGDIKLCPDRAAADTSFTPIRHHLPCPDEPNDSNPATTNDDDGLEATRDANGDCPLSRGALPWATLGVKSQDAWGNRYTYAVTPEFANNKIGFTSQPDASNPTPITPTTGTLNVRTDSTCTTTSIPAVPIIVVSHGANGRGAQNVNGGTPLTPAAVPANERLNLASYVPVLPCEDTDFANPEPDNDFDDLMIWLSDKQIFSRVCPSGGCP